MSSFERRLKQHLVLYCIVVVNGKWNHTLNGSVYAGCSPLFLKATEPVKRGYINHRVCDTWPVQHHAETTVTCPDAEHCQCPCAQYSLPILLAEEG